MTARKIFRALLAVAVVLLAAEATMALGRTVTIFSDTSGRLVDAQGQPQPNITIERSWKRKPEDAPTVDHTVTGPDGTFRFAAVTDTSIMASILPGTPAIKQELIAQGPDGPVTLWKLVKTNFDPNGELDGRPMRLVCRIDKEPDAEGPAWGTCREAAAGD